MSVCIKTDSPIFRKYQKQFNVSEGDLTAAMQKTASSSNQEEALKEYFNIGTTQEYTDKILAQKAREAVDKILKTYSALTQGQRKVADSKIKKLGIPYTFYTTLDGKPAVNMATPVYTKSSKESTESSASDKNSKSKSNKKLTAFEKAKAIIKKIQQDSARRITFDAATHTYYVDGIKADLSVTQYWDLMNEEELTEEQKASREAWFMPASRLGSTVDRVVRDYFSRRLKNNYPNLTASQLHTLIGDLEVLQTMLEEKFEGKLGEDLEVVTAEFPIAAKYSKGPNGEVGIMAGTMDMIVYDKKGNFHILDMKAKRSPLSENKRDMQKYQQQLNMYKAILEANYPELKGKITSLDIIEFRVGYGVPEGVLNYQGMPTGEVTYKATDGLQILADGKPIQKTEKYSSPRLVTQLLKRNIENIDMFEGLSAEDAESLAEEIGTAPVSSQEQDSFSENSSSNGLYGNTLLNASERSFLANYVMNMTSFIITHLQTLPEAKNHYFPDGLDLEGLDFTKMPREEVINKVGIGRIFNYIKHRYFDSSKSNATNFDTLDKLDVAYSNFDALVKSGYAKLIMLEGISVVDARPEDIKRTDLEEGLDDEFNSTSAEEREHEHWQVGIRHTSVRSSLSGEIRRTFEKLMAKDKNQNPIKDPFGFGFDTFIDSSMAVNSILDWCNNCTTMEEMEKILTNKAENNSWVYGILDKIQTEPFRSLFFQNFRKDFTTYSIVNVEYDDHGNKHYVTHIINTKGAHAAILSDIVNSFKLGKMRTMIIPLKGDINGAGRVDISNIKKLSTTRDLLANNISKAFLSQKKESKIINIKKHLSSFRQLLENVGIAVDIKVLEELVLEDVERNNFNNTKLNTILAQVDYILDKFEQADKELSVYDPFARQGEFNVYSEYKNISNVIAKYVQDNIEASTYENGKMHYSFTVPSYMGKLITNLSNAALNQDKFDNFIKEEYTSYKWFKDGNTWNNEWLRLIATEPEKRNNLQHKVQLSFDRTAYTDLSELGYAMSLMQEYFYDKGGKWAWYRLPILANKPSSEFVKFVRYSGLRYKTTMLPLFKKVFNQEVMRIKTVLERTNAAGIQKIGSKGKTTFDIDGNKISEDFKNRIKKGTLRAQDFVKNNTLIYGSSGASFKFLPAFNEVFVERAKQEKGDKYNSAKARLGELLLAKLNGKNNVEEGELTNLFNKVFQEYMELIVEQEINNWTEIGLFDKETKVKKIKGKDTPITTYKYLSQFVSKGDYNLEDPKTEEKEYATIRHKLEEYVWNDMFATINIIELTATDLAYYKNIEDFQKRYSQVHAPSMRLNTQAKMKDGRKYADKYTRTMYLSDNHVKSEIIPNVTTIFNRKIADLTGVDAQHMRMMKDLIITAFEDVNVADAQAFTSPTAIRKKLAMQGKWDDNMDIAYENIKSGNFNINDLEVIWQPAKPFVYSQIRKNSGVDTMAELKVGVQNKNSEYLLLLADALMRSGNMANKLTAIYDFMEDTAYTGRVSRSGKVLKQGTYNARGIDTIQFVSAVNAGSMGAININKVILESILERADTAERDLVNAIKAMERNGNTEKEYELLQSVLKKIKGKSLKYTMTVLQENIGEEIKAILHDAAFKNSDESISTNSKGKLEVDPYNDQFVHNIPWEDYGIQQEVPRHLQDHNQLMGSQMRILSISDITPGTKFQVYTKNGIRTNVDSEDLIREYQEAIAENVRDSFAQLQKDLKLTGTRKEKNKKLSIILQEAILKDQRYGEDLLRACELNSEGEFTIPLSDPIQSIRVQQLLNSIIKSRINKQEVKGGPVVQATSFGLSDELHIRFKDKNGNILKTFSEYGKSQEEYQVYLDKNQSSVAYFECYMPIPSKDLERKLTKTDGSLMSIDEAVEAGIMPEEMRKAIGYRIPTEDKYSMVPLYIKGFLPKAAGEAIMLPKEITLLSGSDFDIDKMYIVLKTFKEGHTINKSEVIRNFNNAVKKWQQDFNNAVKKWQQEKHLPETKAGYNNAKHIRQAVVNYAWEAISNPQQGGADYLKNGDNIANAAYKLYQWYQKNRAKYETVYYKEGNLNKRDTNNNKIFDLQWAVLTNADTMDKMFNPGSFDVQKTSARKISLLKAGHSWEELKDKTLTELDEMSESFSDLNIGLSSTQVYFHKQNMTAGKLIGIFANNNTSHAFLSMQDISLQFEERGFTFDGVRVTNNSNNRLDLQRSKNGALISKTIAGFLAASVDAVKDPVLNFMNLNTMTAGSAMLLARLGFDSDSIGLLLTQPIIERLTREYFKRNNEGYTSVDDVIDDFLQNDNLFEDVSISAIRKDVINTDFSKEELAMQLDPNNYDSEFQARTLLLFQQLATIAQDLQTLTFLTKFNSVTNAVGPTIADTFVMRERIAKFKDKMESDYPPFSKGAHPDNVFANSPILNAFYSTTVADGGASDKIFGEYFPHYSDKFKNDILEEFRQTTKGKIDSKMINKLVNDFVLYKLTQGPNPLINADFKIRNEFIKNFVSTFAKRAEGILDNDLIKIIVVTPPTQNCPVSTLEAKTGGYSADVQERIRNAWTMLIQNPKTRKLGVELFFYNIFRSGFNFSPKSFMHLATVDVKLAIAGYVETIRDVTFGDDDVETQKFLMMFRRNHANDPRIVPKLSYNKNLNITEKNSLKGPQLVIRVGRNKSLVKSIIVSESISGDTYAPVISYNDKIYARSTVNDTTISYVEISPLGNANNFLEYNANEEALSMKSVLDKSSQEVETNTAQSQYKQEEDDGYKKKENVSNKTLDELLRTTVYTKTHVPTLAKIAQHQGENAAIEEAVNIAVREGHLENTEVIRNQIKDVIKKLCK